MPFVIACVGSEFLRSLLTRLRASIDNINIISNILRSISADIFKDERFFKSREKLWSVQMLESFFDELLDRRSLLMGARAGSRRPLFNKAYLAVMKALTQSGAPGEMSTVATAMMASVGVCHERISQLGRTLTTSDLNQIRRDILGLFQWVTNLVVGPAPEAVLARILAPAPEATAPVVAPAPDATPAPEATAPEAAPAPDAAPAPKAAPELKAAPAPDAAPAPKAAPATKAAPAPKVAPAPVVATAPKVAPAKRVFSVWKRDPKRPRSPT